MPSEPARAQLYFDDSIRQFRALADSGRVSVHHIGLGGRVVRLEISTGPMERSLMPAFAHIVHRGPGEADLVIRAWDSESTGAPGISPGWGEEDYRREGYISGFNDGRFHTAIQSNPTILRMIDMERRQALYWTQSAARLPYWEIGAPLRPLLHEWLKRIGMVAVHGGAVGMPEGGVFIAGAGGRGKSNVALACLASDLFYASDDFCFLSRSSGWRVHSLYSTGKISGSDLVRHPHLAGAASNPGRLGEEKALFYLNDIFGDRLIAEMPLLAVVLPKVIGEGPSALVPVPPLAAQRAIALSTIELTRWTGRETLLQIAEMLREIPAFELQVGGAIADAPALIGDLLSRLRRHRGRAPTVSGSGHC